MHVNRDLSRLSKCKPFKIQIGDIVLETVKSAKLLGIHIDNCLIWLTLRGRPFDSEGGGGGGGGAGSFWK